MTHRYVCQDMDNPLHAWIAPELTTYKTQPRVFVLPDDLLHLELWGSGGWHQQFGLLINGRTPNPFVDSKWKPTANRKTYTVVSEKSAERIQAFAEALCKFGNTPADAVLFVNGPVFRRLRDLASVSHMTFDSYLVWDRGEEDDEAKRWPEACQERHARAWRGAGWLALGQRTKCGGLSEECFAQLRPDLDDAADGLARHHDSSVVEQAGAMRTFPIEPKRRVAQRIARFLPRYRLGDAKAGEPHRWRFYGANSEAGLLSFRGPIPWQGWRDRNLDPLERDMLFESWLVPFQNPQTNAWTLQPGSLIMLYWAGRLLDLWDPLPCPKCFIEMHDWRGWFGGRL